MTVKIDGSVENDNDIGGDDDKYNSDSGGDGDEVIK